MDDLVEVPLFDLQPDQVKAPATVADPVPDLSYGRRLTIRQSEQLAKGIHPMGGRLHEDAAPADDRRAPGLRCSTCQFRQLVDGGKRRFGKCLVDGIISARVTSGPATDVRAWWPACRRYQPEEAE